jgi:OOP family OmpA-OmpF porin
MLSQKRADAVKSTLINEFNIDKSRLTAEGFGQKQLLSKGNTKADHNLNRRVVAKIETVEKKVITK